MCGICGFVNFQDQKLLKSMTRRLGHRGPDAEGFYTDKSVSLGHRRLAVIDLSQGGHQPFVSEDKKRILIVNGEIYNYQILREKLIKKGHRFKGQSDNEVILHGYEEWQWGLLNRLEGIFAFALWDKTKKSLFLVRDQLGVKPLYYAQVGKSFAFASETKAILAWEKVAQTVDPAAIDAYLTWRYLPGEKTMFSQVKKMPPGSILVFKKGRKRLKRYWQPPQAPTKIRGKEAAIKLRKNLTKTVVSQLVSDVPLGTYLSGGLDSSLITALAQKNKKKRLQTYALGFGAATDEINKSEKVSEFIKTDHRSFLVKKKDLRLLPQIVSYLDEPVGDPIILPHYLLAREARKKLKVVLTGDGADEIFGGYIHHQALHYKEKIKKITGLGNLFFPLMPEKIFNLLFPYPASLGSKGKERFLAFWQAKTLSQSFLAFANLFTLKEKKKLYHRDFYRRLKDKKAVVKETRKRFVQSKGEALFKIINQDLSYWLPDYILYLSDRLSMANGLEIRVPYLDQKIIKLALSLPANLKIKGLCNKYLLRKATTLLPRAVVKGKKQAFFMPLEKFLGREFDRLIERTLSRKQVEKRGFFNYQYVKKLKTEVKKDPFLMGKQLMALVILELWCQHYLDDGQKKSSKNQRDY